MGFKKRFKTLEKMQRSFLNQKGPTSRYGVSVDGCAIAVSDCNLRSAADLECRFEQARQDENISRSGIDGAKQVEKGHAADGNASRDLMEEDNASIRSDTTPWKIGDKVVVDGLKKATQYNGKTATILSQPADPCSRYTVLVHGSKISVLTCNLKKAVYSEVDTKGQYSDTSGS